MMQQLLVQRSRRADQQIPDSISLPWHATLVSEQLLISKPKHWTQDKGHPNLVEQHNII